MKTLLTRFFAVAIALFLCGVQASAEQLALAWDPNAERIFEYRVCRQVGDEFITLGTTTATIAEDGVTVITPAATRLLVDLPPGRHVLVVFARNEWPEGPASDPLETNEAPSQVKGLRIEGRISAKFTIEIK